MTAKQNPSPEILDLSVLPADALLTRTQLAAVSNFSADTLKKWAWAKRGPTVTKIENRVRYRVADARAWLAGRTAAQ